jgi:tetratricopeptide (TPR) repeat protein
VLNSRDVKLQQAAWFNLGNAHFRSGQEKLPNFETVQPAWETAIKCFQNAVTLDKNDRDATFNLALTERHLAALKELLEMARRAKESADDAARRRNYHRAVEILETLTQKNPVTAKQFEDFLKKLKDIDAIATPHQP